MISPTPVDYGLVTRINAEVNDAIEYERDPEARDVWNDVNTMLTQMEAGATPAGDCEEYVRIKMLRLWNAGVPLDQLWPRIGKTETGEGHAWLEVRDGQRGYWILDNRFTYVGDRPLRETLTAGDALSAARPWETVPHARDRWPNFTPKELRCRGSGLIYIDEIALDRLQAARNLVGRPFPVTSAYRTPLHNKRVGGAQRSQHLLGRAFDISMRGLDPADFEAACKSVGFTGFGFYPDHNFIHVDVGPPRSWGRRWF